jgi:hypothetical protein
MYSQSNQSKLFQSALPRSVVLDMIAQSCCFAASAFILSISTASCHDLDILGLHARNFE